MSYLNVLPLQTVKDYLRIDDSQNETDTEITSMIRSALSYIERHTNIMFYDRNKEFIVKDRCVRVYDSPINSVVKGIDDDGDDVTLTYKTNYNKEEKNHHIIYNNIDGEAVKLVLNVGYDDVANVPAELLDLAKVIIDVMFHEADGNKDFKSSLPLWAVDILNSNKRFVI